MPPAEWNVLELALAEWSVQQPSMGAVLGGSPTERAHDSANGDVGNASTGHTAIVPNRGHKVQAARCDRRNADCVT